MRFICALLAALAVLGIGPGTSRAAPTLWVAKSPGCTVYLFGTVNVVKSGTDWETPRIARSLANSRELWLEVTDDDPATARPLIAELGVDHAHSLSSKVSASELAQIDTAAKAAGLPGEQTLEPMRPWLAAVTLAVVPIIKAGYDPNNGVDKALKAEAAAQHKSIHAFETLDQQLHFFADLPPGVELQFLQSTLDDIGEGPKKIEELLSAWSSGDRAAMEEQFSDLRQPKYRDIYQALIVRRNHAWARQIADLLATTRGHIFVAVGAGHFTGADALQKLLRQRGIEVIRR